MKVYIDGKFYDEKDAKISVFDHGLLYGDGVFEGIRAYNGRVFKLKEHIDRLFYSAKAILLEIPMSHAEIMAATVESCRKNKIRDGYVRLLVTRGPGTLGLNPNRCKKPSVIVIADKIQLYPPEFYEHGMAIVTVPTMRNLHSAVNPAIKSLNYLNNILAKIEAKRVGAAEAILLDRNGYVTECTADNIFIVRGGVVITPPAYIGALKGISRDAAMEVAAEHGYQVREEVFTVFDMFTADECFLTGTAVEIAPVVWVDGKTVGNGRPGQVTERIRKGFAARTRQEGTRI